MGGALCSVGGRAVANLASAHWESKYKCGKKHGDHYDDLGS